ncbi:hypothetical protein Lal_00041047 [Lupinus albus]|uniref:Uncharacterized protein n=1 Tax=Lupinus albus TaxID=3870 RepID=A0A6A4PKB0_LUPAL|nr:hypothetical protein Lalb_Chr13g0301271 [Lupinus albus]KAF1887445.1 hypothetical protein Lal_00041047 [Lupinus albus]
MRPSFVVSLLLLSLLLTKAQGIRLGKGSLEVQPQKHHDEESALLKTSDSDAEEAILCKDEQCKGNIKNRKFVTTVSTTYTISKNVNKGENEALPLVNGNNNRSVKVNVEANERKVNKLSTIFKHQDYHQHKEQYPNLEDITEMDYSPARRKPPIHN